MKRCGLIVSALLVNFSTSYADFSSAKDKTSYALGASVGKNLQLQEVDINPDFFSQGFNDALQGKKLLLSDEQLNQVMVDFQQQLTDKQHMKFETQASANQKAGEQFLAENKAKPGVVTTASGLQYKILKAGTGTSPKKLDRVTVNYEGRLIDGTVFDSSYARKQPATFGVNQVIAGWTEALQLMSPGAEWELYIPAALAYGTRGAPPKIGANAVLIFRVELISVTPA